MSFAPTTISTQTISERRNTRIARSNLVYRSVQLVSAILVLFVISAEVDAGGAPQLNSLSDAQLPRSDRLLILGMSFGNQQGSSQLLLGGLGAIATTWTNTEIHANIPEAAKQDQNNNSPKRVGAAYGRGGEERRWAGSDLTRLGDHRSM